MATIKLNAQNKILTKNGKVSCGCCGELLCCTYPAIGIHLGLFTAEDLPDEILIGDIIDTEEILFTFAKQGEAYYSTHPLGFNPDTGLDTYPTGSVRFAIHNRGGPTWPDQQRFSFHIIWRTEEIKPNGQWGSWAGFEGTQNWLTDYSSSGTTGVPFVKDKFADTYSITGPQSETVTRMPLEFSYEPASRNCRWKGDTTMLRYNGFHTETFETGFELFGNFKWQVRGPDGIWRNKIGFQNTPVGSYEGGYTVS